jgi:two-component system response regulator FixJ
MIVDDEEAVRSSLSTILQTYGMAIVTCANAEEALSAIRESPPDCVIADVRMPDTDGLSLQKLIGGLADAPPVILITGHGDIAMAVQAMKNGAHDFVEKPIDDEVLVASIRAAIAARAAAAIQSGGRLAIVGRYRQLTERERMVADMVADGYSTAAIAATLGISNRTVDHHRANIMAKMQATSLPQLIRDLLSIRRL